MNLNCEALYCRIRKMNKKNSEGISFYPFPSRSKSPERRQQWIQAMKRCTKSGRPWTPGWQSYICSKHFITGTPNTDPCHPDYVPSLLLSEDDVSEPNKELQHLSGAHGALTMQGNTFAWKPLNFVPKRCVPRRVKRRPGRPRKNEAQISDGTPIMPPKGWLPQHETALRILSRYRDINHITQHQNTKNAGHTITQLQDKKITNPTTTKHQDAKNTDSPFTQHPDKKNTSHTISQYQDTKIANHTVSQHQDTKNTSHALSQHRDSKNTNLTITKHQDTKNVSHTVSQHQDTKNTNPTITQYQHSTEAITEFEEAMEMIMNPNKPRDDSQIHQQLVGATPDLQEAKNASPVAMETNNTSSVIMETEDKPALILPADPTPVPTPSTSFLDFEYPSDEDDVNSEAAIMTTKEKKRTGETLDGPEQEGTETSLEELAKKKNLYLELNWGQGKQLIYRNYCKICLNREDYTLLKRLQKYMKRDGLLPKDWPRASMLAVMPKDDDDEDNVEENDDDDDDDDEEEEVEVDGDDDNGDRDRERDPESLCVQEMSEDNKPLELKLSPLPLDDEKQSEELLQEEWDSDGEETQPYPQDLKDPIKQDHSYCSHPPQKFPSALKRRLDLSLQNMCPEVPWMLMPWPSQRETYPSEFDSAHGKLTDLVCGQSLNKK